MIKIKTTVNLEETNVLTGSYEVAALAILGTLTCEFLMTRKRLLIVYILSYQSEYETVTFSQDFNNIKFLAINFWSK